MHLYFNHFDQARLQRASRVLPRLILKDRGQGLFDYEADDAFEAYDPHPHISAPGSPVFRAGANSPHP